MSREPNQNASGRAPMSIGRLLAVVVVAAIAFVAGFYAGLIGLLVAVGFGDIAGAQFELATVPVGGVFAGVAAALVSPQPFRLVAGRIVGTTVAVAVLMALVLVVLDGDYGLAIGIGGGAVLVVATVATVRAGSAGEDAGS